MSYKVFLASNSTFALISNSLDFLRLLLIKYVIPPETIALIIAIIAEKFLSKIFRNVGSQKEMREVLEETGPCIIMATSGMMNGGTSVEYFKKFAEDENNSLIFVGYQANGTLGRRLLNGEKEILLQNTGSKDDKLIVNMQINKLDAFSGHADIKQIKRYFGNLSSKPRLVIIDHGERSKIMQLAGTIDKLIRCKVRTPENLESVRLN